MVRFGVIGIGIEGTKHVDYLMSDGVPHAELVGVADCSPAVLEGIKNRYGDSIRYFLDAQDLIRYEKTDAVIVSTPHYSHVECGIAVLKEGKHLLCEKPIGVYAKNVHDLLEAAERSTGKFAMMFNQRTDPVFMAMRDIIVNGELGGIKRFIWICTSWYRSQAYYNQGGWKGTWAGEGGALLINQCPHNMDMLYWIFGMPDRIWAKTACGKFHNIEVEDEATIYMEYNNGVTGICIASTGDAPGTNRLEISGDNGKLLYDSGDHFGKLMFNRNDIPEPEFSRQQAEISASGFERPPCKNITVTPESADTYSVSTGHKLVIENFATHILYGEPLIAAGAEGLSSLEILNAINYSAWTNSEVQLPVDENHYYELLMQKIENSKK